MDDLDNLFEMPSPSNSPQYTYGGEVEQYIDEPRSSIPSPYLTYLPEHGSISHVYPSPEREVEEPAPSGKQPAAKRKRENRYKNAPPSVLSRRRAQNRASQRAYRERKDQRIKDLEKMLSEAMQRNDMLSQTLVSMHTELLQLKASQPKDYPGGLAFGPDPTTIGMANNDRLELDMFIYSGEMSQGIYPHMS